jgi:hypothetical protein
VIRGENQYQLGIEGFHFCPGFSQDCIHFSHNISTGVVATAQWSMRQAFKHDTHNLFLFLLSDADI